MRGFGSHRAHLLARRPREVDGRRNPGARVTQGAETNQAVVVAPHGVAGGILETAPMTLTLESLAGWR